jgi:16S rRNA (cytosine1402-N4)-methyltransferase
MIKHVPVLIHEAIENLSVNNSGIYIDCTLGGGGYTKSILEKMSTLKDCVLISIDIDKDAIVGFIEDSSSKYTKINENIQLINLDSNKHYLVNDNFSNLKNIVTQIKTENPKIKDLQIIGITADLGLNSSQLDNKLGLSFQNTSQDLDMRIDANSNVKASDLIKVGTEKQLAELFDKYGDVKNSYKLAKRLKSYVSSDKPFLVDDLVHQIDLTYSRTYALKNDLHAKVFQALRIAVNNEFQNLEDLINQSCELLDLNGKLVIVDFHSGEDRIVKHLMKTKVNFKSIIQDDIISPSENELSQNPRSRSAKLRAYKKL